MHQRHNLGQLLQATNRFEEAEPLMRRALEISKASFGEHHPDVAICLNNLGQLLKNTNRFEEAEPLLRRALEISKASFGEHHPDVAICLNNLGQLLKNTNRFEEAEPLIQQAVRIGQHWTASPRPCGAGRERTEEDRMGEEDTR